MSRIGKKAITLPPGVSVTCQEEPLEKKVVTPRGKERVMTRGKVVTVKGPRGTLKQEITGSLTVAVEKERVVLRCDSTAREDRAKWGLYRALIQNMILGVTQGYQKRLQIVGVGYRARLEGKNLQLQVGYNAKQPQRVVVPEGITITCPSEQEIVVSGIDKQKVGQMAAKIRAVRLPEPYKGKGIRYWGEEVRRLAGKTFAAGK